MSHLQGLDKRVVIEVSGVMIDPRSERTRVQKNNRRAFKKGKRADLSVAEWMLVLFLHNFHCVYCGRPYETMDHIISINQGGGTTLCNVVPACDVCNSQKGEAVWL